MTSHNTHPKAPSLFHLLLNLLIELNCPKPTIPQSYTAPKTNKSITGEGSKKRDILIKPNMSFGLVKSLQK